LGGQSESGESVTWISGGMTSMTSTRNEAEDVTLGSVVLVPRTDTV